MDKRQIDEELKKVEEWKLTSGGKITRKYEFKDFLGSMEFVKKVAKVAEETQHHPDIEISYNKVTLTLTTHDEGGVTKKDFSMAKKIDTINP